MDATAPSDASVASAESRPLRLRWLRRIAVAGCLAGVALTGWMVLGPYDYACQRCGASATGTILRSVRPTDTSRWLTKLGLGSCRHDWIVNSSMLGLADRFAVYRIPVCQLRSGRQSVEAMPDPGWQREMLGALMDEQNRLRWLVLLVLEADGEHAPTRSRADWETWRHDFELLFRSETAPDAARAKARAILGTVRRMYPNWDTYLEQRLNRELQQDAP